MSRTVLIAALCAAGALWGCGGGGSDPASRTEGGSGGVTVGTGGTSATGGQQATGGAPSPGTGGAPASGGATGGMAGGPSAGGAAGKAATGGGAGSVAAPGGHGGGGYSECASPIQATGCPGLVQKDGMLCDTCNGLRDGCVIPADKTSGGVQPELCVAACSECK